MDTKVAAIVAHITLIGLILALCCQPKDGSARFWVNQALVIFLFGLLVIVPCIGWVWGVFIFVCWIMSLVSAINQEEKPVPLIGGVTILK